MAASEEIVQALREHPFTHDLEEEDRQVLAELATLREFQPGELLIHEGRAADTCFLLLEGLAVVELITPRGTLRLQTVEGGEIVGWSWMVPPYRWTADVRALTPVLAIAIDAERLRQQFEAECPSPCFRITQKLITVVARRFDALRLRLLDFYGPPQGEKP